jgi:hypothetical protein
VFQIIWVIPEELMKGVSYAQFVVIMSQASGFVKLRRLRLQGCCKIVFEVFCLITSWGSLLGFGIATTDFIEAETRTYVRPFSYRVITSARLMASCASPSSQLKVIALAAMI